jgi:hypothetical protein
MKALPFSVSVCGLGTANSLSVGLVAYQLSLLLCLLGEKKFFKKNLRVDRGFQLHTFAGY